MDALCSRFLKKMRKIRQSVYIFMIFFAFTCFFYLNMVVKNAGLCGEPSLERYVAMKIDDTRRTGNLMFNYASLLGIATRNHMIPTVPKDNPLQKIFKLGMKTERRASWWNSRIIVRSERSYEYDNRTKNLDVSFKNSIFRKLYVNFTFFYDYALVGYFQNYKYFENVTQDLKEQHFRFRDDVVSSVNNFFLQTVTGTLGNSIKNPIYIGVHIRRGDMAQKQKLQDYGYTIANSSYILNAMQYLQKRFPENDVVFIVCTDAKKWFDDSVRKRILSNASVVLSNSLDPGIEMAILAHCNHSIITVGSFGWWSAWLAGGQTVYYKDWPRKGSTLAKDVERGHYFPPTWIPMS